MVGWWFGTPIDAPFFESEIVAAQPVAARSPRRTTDPHLHHENVLDGTTRLRLDLRPVPEA